MRKSNYKKSALLLMVTVSFAAGSVAAEKASFSQGRGTMLVPALHECAGGRPTPAGTVKSSDGKTWTVPAETEFRSAPRATDLVNPCTGVRPRGVAGVDLEKVPVVEIDPGGTTITGYLMADNYFELFVNGRLIGVDAVPFTPFNMAVVRFKVRRPYTLAVKLVDWEENLGLGTESSTPGGGGDAAETGFHPGDGGFIARFSDGTTTDASWKAQSFYIAPLGSPADVVENGDVHDTPRLGRTYPEAPAQAACRERCYAAHYPVPANWKAASFEDAHWPAAALFTREQMGLRSQGDFGAVIEAFGDAQVIWSRNLVYDNLVLARRTVR